MPKMSIPSDVQAEVQKLIDKFNRKYFRTDDFRQAGITGYSARFKGRFLYLDRDDFGGPSPICRLTWNGAMDDWGFAIYKYSDNRYDPEEWLFPGGEHVDGTVHGAMKAGMEAYEI